MDDMKSMGYHAHSSDHRELLRGQAQMQSAIVEMAAAQGRTLEAIGEMRKDMREMLTASRTEARAEIKDLRDRYDADIGDLHSRINETDKIARATETKMSGIIWGLRGAWGAIAVGVVGLFMSLFGGK